MVDSLGTKHHQELKYHIPVNACLAKLLAMFTLRAVEEKKQKFALSDLPNYIWDTSVGGAQLEKNVRG